MPAPVRHRRLALSMAIVATLTLSGCGEDADTRLADAWKKTDNGNGRCSGLMWLEQKAEVEAGHAKPHAHLGDGDQTLTIDGIHGPTIDQLLFDCVFDELDTPDSVKSLVSDTTALMGRQREEAGGIEYVWSYHPDNGLDITMTTS
jgi:hypothetical protein